MDEILNKTKEDYNIIASHFSGKRKFIWNDLRPFLKTVNLGDKVLDVGCGNGRLYKELKTKKIKYLGIDFSQELLKIAKKQNPKAKFKYADLADKKTWKYLKDFDVCCCFAVLHHFPARKEQLEVLNNIYRILKTDGLLIVSVWNLWQKRFWKLHLKQLIWKVIKGFKLKWLLVPYKATDNGKPDRIVNRFCYTFSMRELGSLMKQAGFQMDDKHPSNSLGSKLKFVKPVIFNLEKKNLCLIGKK